jgi:HPt (histidine-containing phosphotransfer) domain-containing protein
MNDLDKGILKELVDDVGKEIAIEIIMTYLNEVNNLINQIPKAMKKLEHKSELERLFHTLKSSSATFGAIKLSEMAKKFEEQVINNEKVTFDIIEFKKESEKTKVNMLNFFS